VRAHNQFIKALLYHARQEQLLQNSSAGNLQRRKQTAFDMMHHGGAQDGTTQQHGNVLAHIFMLKRLSL